MSRLFIFLMMFLSQISFASTYSDFLDLEKEDNNRVFIDFASSLFDKDSSRFLILDGPMQRTARSIHQRFPGIDSSQILSPQMDEGHLAIMAEQNPVLSELFSGTSNEAINHIIKEKTFSPNSVYLDYTGSPGGSFVENFFPFEEISNLLRNSEEEDLVLAVSFSKRGLIPVSFPSHEDSNHSPSPCKYSNLLTATQAQISATIREGGYRKIQSKLKEYRRISEEDGPGQIMMTFFFHLKREEGAEENLYPFAYLPHEERKGMQLKCPNNRVGKQIFLRWGYDPKIEENRLFDDTSIVEDEKETLLILEALPQLKRERSAGEKCSRLETVIPKTILAEACSERFKRAKDDKTERFRAELIEYCKFEKFQNIANGYDLIFEIYKELNSSNPDSLRSNKRLKKFVRLQNLPKICDVLSIDETKALETKLNLVKNSTLEAMNTWLEILYNI